jgi:uncharacterized protein involved in exopolysaccharide biosynthesis
MPDSFNAWQYLDYLWSRSRFIAATAGIATILAGIGSLLLSKRYTATARILIDAPAGADPRSAMSVSPIYLESLRTYEHFASSDSLFLRAIDRFNLRDGRAAEALKKSMLKVAIPRNTRILEIRATLPDANKAQAVAQFIAEETVNLNRTTNREGELEAAAEAERQYTDARLRFEDTEAAWVKASASGTKVQEADRLRRVAQERADAAARRLQEARAVIGYRGERLKIIDAGIVPERPSFPNIPLNVAAAFVLSTTCSIVYFTFAFGLARRTSVPERPQLRIAGARDG